MPDLTREIAAQRVQDTLTAAQIRNCDAGKAWAVLAALTPSDLGRVALLLWDTPRAMNGAVRDVLFRVASDKSKELWESDPALAARLAEHLYYNAPTATDKLNVLQQTADKLRPLARENITCALDVCRFLCAATACPEWTDDRNAQDARRTAIEETTSLLKNHLNDDMPAALAAIAHINTSTKTLSPLARTCLPAAVLRAGRPAGEVLSDIATHFPALAGATALALLDTARIPGKTRGEVRRAFSAIVKGLTDPKTVIGLHTNGQHTATDKSVYAALRRMLKPSRTRGGLPPAVAALDAILAANSLTLVFNTLGTDEGARAALFARLLKPAPLQSHTP